MNQSQNNMMLFASMAGLLALVGIGQGWDVALLLLNKILKFLFQFYSFKNIFLKFIEPNLVTNF